MRALITFLVTLWVIAAGVLARRGSNGGMKPSRRVFENTWSSNHLDQMSTEGRSKGAKMNRDDLGPTVALAAPKPSTGKHAIKTSPTLSKHLGKTGAKRSSADQAISTGPAHAKRASELADLAAAEIARRGLLSRCANQDGPGILLETFFALLLAIHNGFPVFYLAIAVQHLGLAMLGITAKERDDLLQQCKEAKEDVVKSEARAVESAEQLNDMQQQLDATRFECQQRVAEARRDCDAMVRESRDLYVKASAACSNFEAAKKTYDDSMANQTAEHNDALAALRSEHAGAVDRMRQNQIQALADATHQHNKELDARDAALSKAKDDHIKELAQRELQLADSTAAHLAELSNAQQALASATKSSEKKLEELQAAHNEEIARREEAAGQVEAALGSTRAENDKLSAQLTELEESCKFCSDCEAWQAEKVLMIETFDEQALRVETDLQSQLDAVREEMEGIRGELVAKASELDQANATVEAEQARSKLSDEQRETADTLRATMEKERDEARAALAVVQSKAKNAEEQVAATRKQLADGRKVHTRELADRDSQIAELQRSNDNLDRARVAAADAKTQSEAEHSELSTSYTALQSTLLNVQEQNTRLEMQLSRAKDARAVQDAPAVKAAEERAAALKQKVEEAHKEVERVNKRCLETAQKLKSANMEIGNLQGQLASFKVEIAQLKQERDRRPPLPTCAAATQTDAAPVANAPVASVSPPASKSAVATQTESAPLNDARAAEVEASNSTTASSAPGPSRKGKERAPVASSSRSTSASSNDTAPPVAAKIADVFVDTDATPRPRPRPDRAAAQPATAQPNRRSTYDDLPWAGIKLDDDLLQKLEDEKSPEGQPGPGRPGQPSKTSRRRFRNAELAQFKRNEAVERAEKRKSMGLDPLEAATVDGQPPEKAAAEPAPLAERAANAVVDAAPVEQAPVANDAAANAQDHFERVRKIGEAALRAHAEAPQYIMPSLETPEKLRQYRLQYWGSKDGHKRAVPPKSPEMERRPEGANATPRSPIVERARSRKAEEAAKGGPHV